MNAAAKRVNTMHAFIWADKDGVYSWYFEYTGDYKRLPEQLSVDNLSQTEDMTVASRKRLFHLINSKTVSCGFNQHTSDL